MSLTLELTIRVLGSQNTCVLILYCGRNMLFVFVSHSSRYYAGSVAFIQLH